MAFFSSNFLKNLGRSLISPYAAASIIPQTAWRMGALGPLSQLDVLRRAISEKKLPQDIIQERIAQPTFAERFLQIGAGRPEAEGLETLRPEEQRRLISQAMQAPLMLYGGAKAATTAAPTLASRLIRGALTGAKFGPPLAAFQTFEEGDIRRLPSLVAQYTAGGAVLGAGLAGTGGLYGRLRATLGKSAKEVTEEITKEVTRKIPVIAEKERLKRIPIKEVPEEENIIGTVVKAIKQGQFKIGQRGAQIRAQRGGRIESAQKSISEAINRGDPDAALSAWTKALSGEYKKPDMSPLKEIITPEQAKQLKLLPFQSEGLNDFEKGAMAKAFDVLYKEGKFPARGMLDTMNLVYGQDFVQTIKTIGKIRSPIVTQILGLPRTLKAFFDISMGGRQGLVAAARFPKEWVIANKESIKYLANSKYYNKEMLNIGKSAENLLGRKYGLATRAATGRKEEIYAAAELAEGIPIVGRAVKASERAYNGGLTKLRSLMWKKQLNKFGGMTETEKKLGTKGMLDLAEVINTITGVGGKKGGFLERHATTLNESLFSPKLWGSRLQMLNPFWYYRLSPVARRLALESAGSFAGLASLALGAAAAAGATVERDPRSADFLKIKVGDTRYDILAGFQPNLVFAWRMYKGEMKSSVTKRVTKYGEQYGGPTRLSALEQLVRGKTTPLIGTGLKFLEGKDITGKPIEPYKELASLFIPMAMEDTYDVIANLANIPEGLIRGLPAFVGIGTQTYSKYPPRRISPQRKTPSFTEEFLKGFKGE